MEALSSAIDWAVGCGLHFEVAGQDSGGRYQVGVSQEIR